MHNEHYGIHDTGATRTYGRTRGKDIIGMIATQHAHQHALRPGDRRSLDLEKEIFRLTVTVAQISSSFRSKISNVFSSLKIPIISLPLYLIDALTLSLIQACKLAILLTNRTKPLESERSFTIGASKSTTHIAQIS